MAIGTGAAILGGAVVGGLAGTMSASKAAKAQRQAADMSVAEQRRQFDTALSIQRPAIQTGNRARTALERLYGIEGLDGGDVPGGETTPTGYTPGTFYGGGMVPGFKIPGRAVAQSEPIKTGSNGEDRYSGFYASPGYKFRLAEGAKALEQSAAARGKLFSGQTGKALTEYGQGVASDEFGKYTGGLFSLAGYGQNAGNAASGAAISTGRSIGDTMTSAGAARASAYMDSGNSINNAVQGGLSNWLIYRGLGG